MQEHVIGEISLADRHRPTGFTRHYYGYADSSRVEVPRPVALRLVQYEGDAPRVYLFYCDASGEELTDTLHDSLLEAMEQAEAEFGVGVFEWDFGPALAAVGTPQVDAIVSWLILDSPDTAIADRVAQSLLAGELDELRLFASSWHRAHDLSTASVHHMEIGDHLKGVLSGFRFEWDVHDPRRRRQVIASLTQLLSDASHEVRHGARALLDVLAAEDGRP